MSTKASIDAVGGIVLSILFAGNVYFIKNLVDKLEQTETSVWQLKVEVAGLAARLGECARIRKGDYHGQDLPEGRLSTAF